MSTDIVGILHNELGELTGNPLFQIMEFVNLMKAQIVVVKANV